MGAHLIDGEFQSDKYPTCPRGKVPLSVKDPTAQDLLWEYAQRRRSVDAEFSADLETALKAAGYASGTWEDKPLPEDEAISAAFPTRSGSHDTYAEAMRLVSACHSKGRLLALVNWLLVERPTGAPSSDADRLPSRSGG